MAHIPAIQILEKSTQDSRHPLDAKSTIELARLRTQIKKLEKQLTVRPDEKKQQQLLELQQQLIALQDESV